MFTSILVRIDQVAVTYMYYWFEVIPFVQQTRYGISMVTYCCLWIWNAVYSKQRSL